MAENTRRKKGQPNAEKPISLKPFQLVVSFGDLV